MGVSVIQIPLKVKYESLKTYRLFNVLRQSGRNCAIIQKRAELKK